VIDLSADYRLTDAQVYADWYGHVHDDPEGLRRAVYGLPELYREAIPPADLIANPGCYTSASILALAPLIAEGRIERTGIIIDAKSGVSGAGRTPKLSNLFPECNESLSAYGVGRHRHQPEIEQVLTEVGKGPAVEVLFTPHLVPMDRGILATIYASPRSSADVWAMLLTTRQPTGAVTLNAQVALRSGWSKQAHACFASSGSNEVHR